MGSRLAGWVEYTAEMCRHPRSAFPTVDLLSRLGTTFQATVSWHWMASGARASGEVVPLPAERHPATAVRLAHRSDTPLLLWPGGVGTSSLERARPLFIPVAASSGRHGAFLICPDGRDLLADQLALARQLQPLLMLLEMRSRQATAFDADLATHFELTARESSVLCLLRRGMTMQAIGRRLSCSPRTVEKHLEHIYRKLGVRDRVSAVRTADAYAAALSRQHETAAAAANGAGEIAR